MMEREEEPRPTLALEYCYARRTGKTGGKEVAHLWEIGGGTATCNLLDVALNESAVKTAVVVIAADLSKPEEVFPMVSFWLDKLRARLHEIEKNLKAKPASAKVMDQLRERAAKRFGEKHPDNARDGVIGKGSVRHTGVTVVIVATKFDQFSQKDPELKRVMARSLRFLAHSNGASLLYTSKDDKQLVAGFRNVLTQWLFKGQPVKTKVTDHLKGLLVPAGADSHQDIGTPPVADKSAFEKGMGPGELWKAAFEAYFGKIDALPSGPSEVPALDPKGQFAERDIDNALVQKEEDLKLYRKAQEKQEQASKAAVEKKAPAAKAPAAAKASRTSSSARAAKPTPAAAEAT
mmetsp:Transcript_23488/g.36745  ORF Transcript_23488/g.36745 Transcript_23488/m.36745 type:complete len:348 (-) Transcript_23488:169-1212(-)